MIIIVKNVKRHNYLIIIPKLFLKCNSDCNMNVLCFLNFLLDTTVLCMELLEKDLTWTAVANIRKRDGESSEIHARNHQQESKMFWRCWHLVCFLSNINLFFSMISDFTVHARIQLIYVFKPGNMKCLIYWLQRY